MAGERLGPFRGKAEVAIATQLDAAPKPLTLSELRRRVAHDERTIRAALERMTAAGRVKYHHLNDQPGVNRPRGMWELEEAAREEMRAQTGSTAPPEANIAASPTVVLRAASDELPVVWRLLAHRTLTAGADSILQIDSDEHIFVLRFRPEVGRAPLERLVAAAGAAGLRCVFDTSPVLRSPAELQGMAEALEEAGRLGRVARSGRSEEE